MPKRVSFDSDDFAPVSQRVTSTKTPPPVGQAKKEFLSEPELDKSLPMVKIDESQDSKVDEKICRKSGGKLGSFVAFPRDTHFEGENPAEEVIMLLRRHPVTNLPWILTSIVLYLAPTIAFPFFFMTGLIPPLTAGFQFFFTVAWYMGTTTFVLVSFLYWYFNAYIITSERVVDIDWYSLNYRQVYTAPIANIQDVGHVVSSVVQSVFDYGSVHIETAASQDNIDFADVPHPALVHEKLSELVQMEENEMHKEGGKI